MFLTNCGPLSVSTWFGMPKRMIQLSKKVFTILVPPVLAACTARLNFDYLPAIAIMYWITCFVLCKDPGMFMATNSTGRHEGTIGAVLHVRIGFRFLRSLFFSR